MFWKNKKVLVTGGAGFIGSHLVELLLSKGAEVSITYLKGSSLKNIENVKNKINLIEANLMNLNDCIKACKGQQIVMNLAARVAGIEFNRMHPATMLRDNIILQQNVIEAARINEVERFLVVSSACVYPANAKIPTPETEGFKGEPEKTNSGYGWGKRFGELLAEKYSEEFGMKIAIARPYNAFGPRDNFNPETSHVIPSLINKVFAREEPLIVFGSGKPKRSFCFVEDVALGLMLCVEKGIGKGAINIGSNEEITIKQLVKLICNISGFNPKIVFDLTKPDGQMRRKSDNSKAKKILGFKAKTSLKEGLKKTIEWYKKNILKN